MDIFVDYSCEENSETGRTKITVCDFDSTSIRDVKYAIQEALQAPVCDQQLFYLGQRVTDDNMPLNRLYFRQGDCFKVQFLAAADVPGMRELLDVLKNFVQQLVERINRQLPILNTEEDLDDLRRFDFPNRMRSVCRTLQKLSDHYFHPWKCLKSVAHRHFFVQEGGFDAFLEVLKFSRQLYTVGHSENGFNVNETLLELTIFLDEIKRGVNRNQLLLQLCCLGFLWNFGETPQDRKFLMSRDIFPLTVEALLLQPYTDDKTGHIGTNVANMIVGVNEMAIGCCAGLAEYDSNIQEEVSKMPPLIDKLLFMIDRCQSEPAGYSLYSSHVASNVIFYCTFNVKSAQSLVDCGAPEKMINITKKLLIDNGSSASLRYYCCLFLARMRSAPLVTLDRDTCVAIDELIEMFLSSHKPSEISKWEEEKSYVWITITPLVHLAFAAGKEYYYHQINGLKSHGKESERSLNTKHSETTTMEAEEARGAEIEESQKPVLTLDKKEENLSNLKICKRRKVEVEEATPKTQCDISESMETETSMTRFTWPGSTSTQKLGIFSLVHMLSIKDNQQLAQSENLLPYLVCLSWHLNCDEREKLRACLANFHNATTPPSLKVTAKSVLALANGLDMVYNV